MRPSDGERGANRHPLDPGVGDVYGPACGPRRDFWACVEPGDVRDHCHCDSHGGGNGCAWGTGELIARLQRVAAFALHLAAAYCAAWDKDWTRRDTCGECISCAARAALGMSQEQASAAVAAAVAAAR